MKKPIILFSFLAVFSSCSKSDNYGPAPCGELCAENDNRTEMLNNKQGSNGHKMNPLKYTQDTYNADRRFGDVPHDSVIPYHQPEKTPIPHDTFSARI
jgi:hypothetical protein